MLRRMGAACRGGLQVLTLVGFATMALAVQPDEILEDPALEARAREISGGLRCPVCQNESIDESHAELARDLRLLVRERLVAGDSDAEVVDHIVARYGEFVLLRPNLDGANRVLWALPLVLLLGGVALTAGYVRARARAAAPAEAGLSPEEQARLDRILAEDRGA